jgi:GTPase SAR1 family protein
MGNNIVKTDKLNIVVIGLKNSGKTTLLNKLIGTNILPTNKETNNNIIISNTNERSVFLLNKVPYQNHLYHEEEQIQKIILELPNSTINRDIVIQTKIKCLNDNNLSNINFYDTIGLSETKSDAGLLVQEIARNASLLLYVINLYDIDKPIIYKHYNILKKYKIKVCLVITHCDKFEYDIYLDTTSKIKNKIINNYILHDINLVKDNTNIIVMNEDSDNFMQLKSIINNLKSDIEITNLNKRLTSMEDAENARFYSGMFGIGIDIVSSIIKKR